MCTDPLLVVKSPSPATKRKRGLLRKPGTLSHSQIPPAFPFFLCVAEQTQPMHVTLCPQQKPQTAQTKRNSYLERLRLCSCEWPSPHTSPGACQPYSPFNNITHLDCYNTIYVCSLAPPPTYSNRSAGITLSAFFKAESRPHWFLEEIVFISASQTVPQAILPEW